MEHEYHATEFVPMSSDDVCQVLAFDGAQYRRLGQRDGDIHQEGLRRARHRRQ